MKRQAYFVIRLLSVLIFLSSGISAIGLVSDVPTLDEMAGDWLPMQNVANLPAVHNFHDMLLLNRDLTSFYCYPDGQLWKHLLRFGYPPVTLTIDDKDYQSTDCRWYPYRALRRNLDCGGFAVETDTRMINEQRAVLVRMTITNPGTTARKAVFALSVSGTLQPDGLSVLNTAQRKGFVTMVCPVQKPDTVSTATDVIHWQWNVALPPGGSQVIEFVSGDGGEQDVESVRTNVTQWSKDFAAQFDGFKKCWEQRWSDTFTPGNKHFSGSLPVLVTDNAPLKRNYYMGIVTMLVLERTQFPVSPRSFITSGERAPGTQFYWDASMQSTVWALLEPAGMKATLRRWLVQNVRKGNFMSIKDTAGFDTQHYDQISGYAFNACTIFKTAWDYLRITGDLSFLDEKLEDGKTVLEHMDAIATDWQTLVLPDSPLANYGENKNLLECAPAYIHRVASANAQDVWMMREAATLQELKGNTARANELRDEAGKLLPAVLDLYKTGDGVWYGLHKDGTRVELRHCVDYIYVGNALAADLTPTMRKEMTGFVERELLQRDWMRAMSLKDAAAAISDRPDHGPMGAYDGWIPLTVGTMWRLGFPKDAFDFYCRTAVVTKEGPFAQAREFYGPNRESFDAPVRVAERLGCMKECISGVAFSDVVVNTFFGFDPSLDGKTMLADPGTPRPFTGSLLHLSFRGAVYTLTANESGVNSKKE
jgi:hypothetical protein